MENILKQAAKYGSNNTASYGIVNAVEVSGFKQVAAVADLYTIADCILQKDKTGNGSDAVGQKWYVQAEACEYQLTSWAGRKSAAGWTKVALADSATVTALSNKLTSVEGTANNATSKAEENATAISTINTTLASGVVSNVTKKTSDTITVTKGGSTTDIQITKVAEATTADNAKKVNSHTVGSDVPADAVFTDTKTTVSRGVKDDAALTIVSSSPATDVTDYAITINDFACDKKGSTHGLVPAVDLSTYGQVIDSGANLLFFSDGWAVPSMDTLGLTSMVNSLQEDIAAKVNANGDGTPYIKTVVKSGNTLTFTPATGDAVTFTTSEYSLPLATDTVRGGVKIGYTESGKNYAVKLDANEKMYVNVPWTDTVTPEYTLPVADNGTLGGIMTAFIPEEGDIYKHAVKTDDLGNAYVEAGAPTIVITLNSAVSGNITGDDYAQINSCYEVGAPVQFKFTEDADEVAMSASIYMDSDGKLRCCGILNTVTGNAKYRAIVINPGDRSYTVEEEDLIHSAISEAEINEICKIS